MRKKTDISPLIAARMRPIRLAPNGLPAGIHVSRPRLAAGAKMQCPAAVLATAKTADQKASRMLDAISAVRTASAALEEIHRLLHDLEKVLRRAAESRRRPPSGMKVLQDRIDATMKAIDAVVHNIADESIVPVELRQRYAQTKTTSVGDPPTRDPCPTLELADLDRGRSLLSMIRAGGAQSLERASVAQVHAIVRQTASQVHAQRRELELFLVERLGPACGEVGVAAENRAAALAATDDSEFSGEVSHMTGAELLLHILNLRAEQRRKAEPLPPVLRVVTDSPQDNGPQGG